MDQNSSGFTPLSAMQKCLFWEPIVDYLESIFNPIWMSSATAFAVATSEPICLFERLTIALGASPSADSKG